MSRRNPLEERQRSDLIALFFLAKQDLSGYGIRKLIRDWNMGDYLGATPATIYRALERLRKHGFVKARKEQRGRYPQATVYAITPKGETHYRKLVHEVAGFRQTAYTISPFLGVGQRLPGAVRIELSEAWIREAQDRVDALDVRIKDHVPGHTYGKAYSEWLIMDHERHQLRSEIAWLKAFIRRVAKGAA